MALDDSPTGFQFKTLDAQTNTLTVEFRPTFMYFVFISYVARMRGIKIDIDPPPATKEDCLVEGVHVDVISRTIQLCFFSDMANVRVGEEGTLLLVDLIRIRNRGSVHYPTSSTAPKNKNQPTIVDDPDEGDSSARQDVVTGRYY